MRNKTSSAGLRPILDRRRVVILALLGIAAVLAASSTQFHDWLTGMLEAVEPVIRERPVVGGIIFLILAAASAMLAFFSSAAVVPIGVYVWGKLTCMLLLWIGWIAGGACAYAVASHLGRLVVQTLISRPTHERYERFLNDRTPFWMVVLFQSALPSELPGYLLGLVRYPFSKYLAALAIVELPYALATVYLGESFVEGKAFVLIFVGLAATAASALALYTLNRRLTK
jgi:uncharacterized membrane protein YdjX (TVP38/TMEM64 family)